MRFQNKTKLNLALCVCVCVCVTACVRESNRTSSTHGLSKPCQNRLRKYRSSFVLFSFPQIPTTIGWWDDKATFPMQWHYKKKRREKITAKYIYLSYLNDGNSPACTKNAFACCWLNIHSNGWQTHLDGFPDLIVCVCVCTQRIFRARILRAQFSNAHFF